MTLQNNSNQNSQTQPSSIISNDLIKIVVVLGFAASVFYLITSHSDCWFSISCQPDTHKSGYEISTILVGFLTTISLTAVFSTPLAPAAVVGVLAWVALRFWL
jgi:hypothetical protein